MNICWGSSGVHWAVTSYSPLTSYSQMRKVAVGWRCQRGLILGGDFQTILRLCCRTLDSVVWRNECEVLVAFPFVWEKSCRGPLWIRQHWGTAVDGGTGRSAGPLVIPSWTSWSWLEHATAFFFPAHMQNPFLWEKRRGCTGAGVDLDLVVPQDGLGRPEGWASAKGLGAGTAQNYLVLLKQLK